MDTHTLTTLAADAWAARLGIGMLSYEQPDALERSGPAVDLLGRDSQGRPRLVLEHTLVESFLDQRTSQIAAIEMFRSLESDLSGKLPGPGRYDLTVRPRSVLGHRRRIARIRAAVERWVRETAPTLMVAAPGLGPRHLARLTIPGTQVEICLSRWRRRLQGPDGELGLTFFSPDDTRKALAPSLERALLAKCSKLAAARQASEGAASLLLLEISDIQLGNLFDLDAVLQERLGSPLAHAPDHIWLVDTTDEPPSVMIGKEGTRDIGVLGQRFLPFHLRSSPRERQA